MGVGVGVAAFPVCLITLEGVIMEIERIILVEEAAVIFMEWQIYHVIQDVDDPRCKTRDSLTLHCEEFLHFTKIRSIRQCGNQCMAS